MTIYQLQNEIRSKIPLVVPRHEEKGHKYEVPHLGKIFPSVTTILQIVKDDSIRNWRLNRAIEYMFAHYKEFNDSNIMDHLENAKRTSIDLLEDAGDIGKRIHSYRERLFYNEKSDEDDISDIDIRFISAKRALQKFLDDTGYCPIVSELMVYDAQLGIAGSLDDVGLLPRIVRSGISGCAHKMFLPNPEWKQYNRCMKCSLKIAYDLVLMDLKSSNQYRDHYHIQVALYTYMFSKLTNLRPKKLFILKVSKENGTYDIEEIKDYKSALIAGKNAIKLWYSMAKIKESRKPERIVI